VREHPIRLVASDDLERLRITVFFRALLAIPHFIWLLLWSLLVLLLAPVDWLATLLLGRSPMPLHRLFAAYVKYVTQFYAYLHVAAERYPPFDGQDGYAVDLTIAPPARQRRWTVLLRGILLLPAALLVGALIGDPSGGAGSGASLFFTSSFGVLAAAALLAWFASIARAATPRGLRDAMLYALSYGAQFWGYALLLTDRYPDSDPQALPGLPARDDPIRLEIESDELRRSRLTVFFRGLLSLPHLVWLQLWGVLVLLAAIASWLATLLRGRSPERLHSFLAAYVRYQLHVYAFLYLVANPFPGFVGAAGSYPLEIVVRARTPQNRWKTGFRLILVPPALLLSGAYSALLSLVAVLGWFSALARGRMPRGLRNAGALALRYQAQLLGYVLLLTDAYPYSGPVLLDGVEGGAASSAAPQPQGPPTWQLIGSPGEPQARGAA
jgi:hypothetical protein